PPHTRAIRAATPFRVVERRRERVAPRSRRQPKRSACSPAPAARRRFGRSNGDGQDRAGGMSLDRGQAGQVGGIEAVAFGVLIFVIGILVVANGWAVVDAKLATAAAAREATRAYVEAPSAEAADRVAAGAATDALRGYGRDPNHMAIRRTG